MVGARAGGLLETVVRPGVVAFATFGGPAGERKEHVVQRWLAQLHVVDRDPGSVEGTDHQRGQAAPVGDRRCHPPTTLAGPGRTFDVRRQGSRHHVEARPGAEGELEPSPAHASA